MTVSSCPSCHEQVTVPAGAAGSARVRCPLCSDEFQLSLVLDKLPPMLVLLDTAPAGDVELKLGPETTRAPAFDFDEAAGPSGTRTLSTTPRPKRKEKSMLVEMVKIVGGGVVGIALATLILWWAANRDPLGWAPKVAVYAPWIVPPKLRPAPPPEKESSGVDSGASSSNGKGSNDSKGPGKSGDARTGGAGSESGQGSQAGATKLESFEIDPANTKKPDDDPLNIGAGPVLPGPKETKPKTSTPPEVKSGQTPASASAKGSRFPLAKPLPKASPLELSSAFKSVQGADGAIEQAFGAEGANLSDDDKRKRGNDLYNALARLGEVILAADPTDANIQREGNRMTEQLGEALKNPRKQRILAALAERWLKTSPADRANRGLCVTGVVTRVSPSGKFFEVDLVLATSSKATATVLVSEDPKALYQVGNRVLLLGAMIGDPNKNLVGYAGDAAEIGCVNFFVPLGDDAAEPSAPAAPSSDKEADKEAGKGTDGEAK